MEAQNTKNIQSQAAESSKGQLAGEHTPPAASPVTSGSIVLLASAGTGTSCSGFLLREVLRGTTAPLGRQWPNGMQIGIYFHKDILCMDFLLDFT